MFDNNDDDLMCEDLSCLDLEDQLDCLLNGLDEAIMDDMDDEEMEGWLYGL